MRVVVPMESLEGERRVATTPDGVLRLAKLGFQVAVQRGAGVEAGYTDEAYESAGAELVAAPDAWTGDIVVKVNPPTLDEIELLPKGTLLISMLWPKQNPQLVEALAARGCSAIALDKIPRISRAQKLDVLSSMANIAGYRAVLEAANRLPRFFGGQITAAGKTPPAKVLVIGAGVAGLAAIGAARGLGAQVMAFDTREAVREQVQSMGGTFLALEFEEDGDGAGGYAKVMSEAFIAAEMALFAEQAPSVDIVITTALIPGRPAPLLWKAEHVELMPPGAVVVDLAASQGGNCEVTEPGKSISYKGRSIIGFTDLTSRLPGHASQLFARNVVHLLSDMGGNENWSINLEDVVVRSSLAVHDGEIVPPPPPPEPSPPKKPVEQAPIVATPEPESSGAPMAIFGVGLAVVFGIVGFFAPAEFLQHFTVFVLACVVGWQVVWNVSHSLHTPLMSVTNAISGIILVGGMLQAGSGRTDLAAILGAIAILFAAINVAGGFLVTQRMLAMFRK